jgi:hypothetical protein
VPRASGVPHALFGRKFHQRLGRMARRGRERVFSRHCEPTGRANARPMTGSACPPVHTVRWARRKRAFAHPHMGPSESSIPIGAWVLFLSQGAAAVRGAMHSVAYRRDRRAQGLASGALCSCSLHHLISGRTAMARYPHSACLRRGSYEDETHLRNSLFVGPRVARSSSIPR